MFYNYAELEDGTQVAFSSVLDGGEVQVLSLIHISIAHGMSLPTSPSQSTKTGLPLFRRAVSPAA